MKPNIIIITLSLCLALTSCFKDEPLNAECDIEEAYLHVENPSEVFYNLSDTLVKVLYTDNIISFVVRPNTDLTALAPQFRTTAGATVEPASGTVRDFSNGALLYKVTSEDMAWSRDYYVSFTATDNGSGDDDTTEDSSEGNDTIRFDFETFALNSNSVFYEWSDETVKWASGNQGYALTGMGGTPNDPMNYPTVPDADGLLGYCVRLTTSDTGPFGAMMNMRLAAGNLFIGSFDTQTALAQPRAATLFGDVFTKKPTTMKGYYKFTPGENYQNASGEYVSGQTDEPDVYAVFYRNHDADDNVITLNGDDVKTNEMIVAIAQVTDLKATDEWTEFESEFVYTSDVDLTTLSNHGYSLVVVFSSSTNGAYFEGAIGSTLMIDSVMIVCPKTTE